MVVMSRWASMMILLCEFPWIIAGDRAGLFEFALVGEVCLALPFSILLRLGAVHNFLVHSFVLLIQFFTQPWQRRFAFFCRVVCVSDAETKCFARTFLAVIVFGLDILRVLTLAACFFPPHQGRC